MSAQDSTPRASRSHWHIEHSRDERGVYTLCGHFIPWRTKRGQVAAVNGQQACTDRTPCASCETMHGYRDEINNAINNNPHFIEVNRSIRELEAEIASTRRLFRA